MTFLYRFYFCLCSLTEKLEIFFFFCINFFKIRLSALTLQFWIRNFDLIFSIFFFFSSLILYGKRAVLWEVNIKKNWHL